MKKVVITGGITGLYGCNCHPFESWEEEKAFRTQKLNPGDKVRDRHSERTATISRKTGESGNYYIVIFGQGKAASDHELEHAANLIKLEGI